MMKYIIVTIIMILSTSVFAGNLTSEVKAKPLPMGSNTALSLIANVENKLKTKLTDQELKSSLTALAVLRSSQGQFSMALVATEKLLNLYKPSDRYRVNRVLKLPILYALRQRVALTNVSKALLFDRLIANLLVMHLERGNMIVSLSKSAVEDEKLNLITSWFIGRVLEYGLTMKSRLPKSFETLLLGLCKVKEPYTASKLLTHRKRLNVIKSIFKAGKLKSFSRYQSIRIANQWFYNYLTGSNTYKYLKNQSSLLIIGKINSKYFPSRGVKVKTVISKIAKYHNAVVGAVNLMAKANKTVKKIAKVKKSKVIMERSIAIAKRNKKYTHLLNIPSGLSSKDKKNLKNKKNALQSTIEKHDKSFDRLNWTEVSNIEYASRLDDAWQSRSAQLSSVIANRQAVYAEIKDRVDRLIAQQQVEDPNGGYTPPTNSGPYRNTGR